MVNIVKIKRYIYRSAVYPEIIAYTFGDCYGNKMLKPFKILDHEWERYFGGKYSYDKASWKCKKCFMTGTSLIFDKKSILPTDLLSCDEVMIKDLIL